MLEIRPYNRRNAMVNPFREMEEFDKNFFGFPFAFFDGRTTGFSTDITDNGDSYLLEADLPGFAKEDIHLNIDGDMLAISAERHSVKENKDNKDRVIRSERSFGSYTRQFDVSAVDVENISAKYEDGVLKLCMPKKKENIPQSRTLTIE